jgi:hypothetical protein
VNQAPLGRAFLGTSRFEIIRHVGAGGMGVVYEALDRELGVHVALKTLRAMTPDSLLRFKTEFRDFHTLQHPNLISLGELHSEAGEWFFTMELVPGVSFFRHVRRGLDDDPFTDTMSDGSLATEAMAARSPRGQVGGGFDEVRLRTVLIQLAEALRALHAAHKVHRDIKPSNVLVTPEGRLVVLDFGVAMSLDDRQAERTITGTVQYMAPEQAEGRAVGPAADWYAVGVMLYQVLTGRVPIEGHPLEIMQAKQRAVVPSPRSLGLDVPADLDALCMALLAILPEARPDAREVLARLGVTAPEPAAAAPATTFVGRARELDALDAAFAASRTLAGTVVVRGESGLGKSTLVRQFAERLRARSPDAIVLFGSCYERETVPYKAIDGLIDALSRYMVKLAPQRAAALLPRKAALLAQAFPVMARVPAVAQAPLLALARLDPQELRSQLFAALRELLARIAERDPLVLVIDDLQWADADSLALLGEIMRPPEAPALLFVATAREERDTGWAAHLRGRVEHLALERMSAEESYRLAEELARNAPGAGLSAEVIAREAGGHPQFIDELVRHASAVGAPSPGTLQLEDALGARIGRLEPATQEVLGLVATASARLAQGSGAHAAGLAFGEFARHIAALRAAHLVRTSGLSASDQVEPYHDRVRQAVIARRSPELARSQHRQLALALEAAGASDLEALTIHWREAGDAARTAEFAAAAAEKADKALAFDRAARFYQLALDALAVDDPRRAALRLRLADALASAGRGQEAGEAYLTAAEAGASAVQALDLRRRAAEQFLRSGHLDRGVATLGQVVTAGGLKVAPTPRRALAALLARRVQVRVRGLGFRERDASQLSVDTLTRIDTCWAAAVGFANVDTIRAAHFQTQHLLLALAAGEPYRVARALAMEGGFASTAGLPGQARGERLLAASAALAERIDHPHAIALATLISGVAAFQVGNWRGARERLERADALLRDRCTGVAWELGLGNLFHLSSLFYLGELALLAEKLPRVLEEGAARGDLFATTNLRLSNFTVAWLMNDDVEGARGAAEAGMRDWSRRAASAQEYYYFMLAQANADLYAGDGRAAWERVRAGWPGLEASMFLRVQYVRCESLYLRARAALAAAAAGHDREAALATARRDAVKLAGEGPGWARGLGKLVEAALAHQRGDAGAARRMLEDAAIECGRADLALYAAAARFRHGRLEGGDAGRARLEAARVELTMQRVRVPGRLVDMLAPGFGS